MHSTIFAQDIYLGLNQKTPLTNKSFENTYFGGEPIFLYQPNPKTIQCNSCNNQKMTFICQIFCPFEFEYAYNRVLYIIFCQKCNRFFRCLRQQTPKNVQISSNIIAPLRIISENSFEIISQAMQVRQLTKIINKAKIEVEEEIIEEQEDDDDNGQWEDVQQNIEDMKQYSENIKQHNREFQDEEKDQKEKIQSLKFAAQIHEDKEQKDIVFEQYRKIMSEIDNPILLYSNIPIPYNSQALNPRHYCKFCNSKLMLQVQITEKILGLNHKLVNLDWGSLFIYTCSISCEKSNEECVVVQYEIDAIKESEVEALRNKKKSQKRKENREKSRSKKKREEKQKNEDKNSEKDKQKVSDEGDWD